jgi:hypothetical protein
MGSSSKRQTTMAKLARERALQEKRELKRQKKEARKQAKAAGGEPALDDHGLPLYGEDRERNDLHD